jgi:hypothetical protein
VNDHSHQHQPVHTTTIEIGDPDLNFRRIEIPHEAPTGRQILEAAGVHPIEEYVPLALLPNGDTEALRLDQHLRHHGQAISKVILFKTDRLYRLEIDRREKEWGWGQISGKALKFLAGVDAKKYDVYQEVHGNDPLIPNDGFADLCGPGVERFYTIISETTEGLASLPPEDHAYLEGRGISYEVVLNGAECGVILRGIPMPPGKFDHSAADVLLILPGGYPDAVVDMFHTDPWLRLAASRQFARAANVARAFAGRNWQRWSRHNNAWRPGVDGIHTILARIERALSEAA